ncbi:hypothetical protein [Tautonia sociabilis]|nr:hypothetical protein [Tautonia sociabilis]
MSVPQDLPGRDEGSIPPSSARLPGFGRLIPAAVVLLIPLFLVPFSATMVGIPAEDPGTMPVWAIEAFGVEPLFAALSALTLPMPMMALGGAIALAMPAVGAILGLGTVGRWASLGGFCLAAAVLTGLLSLLLLLGLVPTVGGGPAIRAEVLAALACPVFALEGCGCLLAASMASGGADREGARFSPRRTRGTSVG